MNIDEKWMQLALVEAMRAAEMGEVPVGAVVRSGDGVAIASAHNQREATNDPTAHAEVLALRTMGAMVGSWNLEGATLFVTQEPCPMCAGAIVNARIARVVFGCDNPKAGAVRTLYRLLEDTRLNHRVEVQGGVMAAECGELLTRFFEKLRQKGPN